MRVHPELPAVLAYDGDATHVALSVTLLADTHTPISLFRTLADREGDTFLFESVTGGEINGRWSFLGLDVRGRLLLDHGTATLERRGRAPESMPYDDPLEALRAHLWTVWNPSPVPRHPAGLVGCLGFDAVARFERKIRLAAGRGLGAPEGAFLLVDTVAAYDHVSRWLTLILHVPLAGDRAVAYQAGAERLLALVGRFATARLAPEAPWVVPAAPELPVEVVANRTDEDLADAVSRARAAIEAGEVFQVVPSLRLSAKVRVDALTLYRSLRAVDPSPYMFLLRAGPLTLVGASPEVLVRLEGDELLLRPIAGTRRRGRDADEDRALAAELAADEKELAEHRMLVDLGRNDLGRIAATGTVRVEDPEHVERYAHVMHVVSDVRARLQPGLDAFDVLRACFPAGTVSGAPKVRAASLLSELEPDRRGPYAGAVGYFGADGSLDTCIAIRTMVLDEVGVHVQAGAGVVYDSVPEREVAECKHKARSALKALAVALERGAP
ncbi:MAG: anthranilate synthase component I family protein [Alphaproteobacteria bacterium]|nr:anthranilate synthase component I family protein [Alphaproteobacteria bacterium]